MDPHDGQHERVFGIELGDEDAVKLDRLVERWADLARALRRSTALRRGIATLLILGGLGAPVILGALAVGNVALRLGIAGALIAAGIGAAVWAARSRDRKIRAIAGETSAALEAEGLPRWVAVDALHARLKGSSTDTALLIEIDTEAARLLDLRRRGLQALDDLNRAQVVPLKIRIKFDGSSGKVQEATVQGEKEAAVLRDLAVDYLAAGAPCEALAAIATVATTYGEIAPPGQEDALAARAELGGILTSSGLQGLGQEGDLGNGGVVEVVGGVLKSGASADIVRSTYRVFSSFDFEPEAKTILGSLAARRQFSVLEALTRMMTKEDDHGAVGALAEALEEAPPGATKDPFFIEACLDYVRDLPRPVGSVLGMRNLRWIPDHRVLPWIVQGFSLTPFDPAAIDAVMGLGRNVGPRVAEAFERSSNRNSTFNLALTLGVLRYGQARHLVQDVLAKSTDPIEVLGCHFALLLFGEETRLAELVRGLENHDSDVRHVAAITLEHVPNPIDEQVYLQHLGDGNPLVRLRLVRKLHRQGSSSPKIAEVLVGLLEDPHDAVRDAVIEAIGSLAPELTFEMVEEIARSATLSRTGGKFRARVAALKTLGKIDDERAESTLMACATSISENDDVRSAAIEALGERGSVAAITPLAEHMSGDSDELFASARVALLRIGMAHQEEVLAVLPMRGTRRQVVDGLRAVLGDEKARKRLTGQLSGLKSPSDLITSLESARLIGAGEFESPLRRLLTYSKPANFPADRAVQHLAFGVLIRLLAPKAVRQMPGRSQQPDVDEGTRE